jgi:hypothetical protein
MSTVSTAETTEASTQTRDKVFTATGGALIVFWALAASLSFSLTSLLEILNAAGLLAATLLILIVFKGAAGISRSSAGRLAMTGLFAFSAMALSPLLQRAPTMKTLSASGTLTQLSAWAGLAAIALLWIASGLMRSGVSTQAGDRAQYIELLLSRFTVRANLAAAGILLIVVGLAASGLPLKSGAPRAALAALIVFSSAAVLRLASIPNGVKTLNASMIAALSVCVLGGGWRYMEMQNKVNAGIELLSKDKPEDAQKVHEEARVLNEVLNSKGTTLKVETEWAHFREKKGDFNGALQHWWRIAEIRGVESAEMLPVKRLLCKLGDSLSAWRRLIYNGFPAISDPEMAPGIQALGDLKNADVRASLISALLAWERKEPREEILRRLKDVQRVSPNEPSSRNLLKRMNEPVASSEMWVPAELIIGKKYSNSSLAGTIEELGEVDTIVVLEKGQWEIGLKALGTPLHEEWPIVRIELNGVVVGRTQVTRSELKEYPFSFDVRRGDIYHVKIVFENIRETIDQGHVSRRGLNIAGLVLRQTKD